MHKTVLILWIDRIHWWKLMLGQLKKHVPAEFLRRCNIYPEPLMNLDGLSRASGIGNTVVMKRPLYYSRLVTNRWWSFLLINHWIRFDWCCIHWILCWYEPCLELVPTILTVINSYGCRSIRWIDYGTLLPWFLQTQFIQYLTREASELSCYSRLWLADGWQLSYLIIYIII